MNIAPAACLTSGQIALPGLPPLPAIGAADIALPEEFARQMMQMSAIPAMPVEQPGAALPEPAVNEDAVADGHALLQLLGNHEKAPAIAKGVTEEISNDSKAAGRIADDEEFADEPGIMPLPLPNEGVLPVAAKVIPVAEAPGREEAKADTAADPTALRSINMDAVVLAAPQAPVAYVKAAPAPAEAPEFKAIVAAPVAMPASVRRLETPHIRKFPAAVATPMPTPASIEPAAAPRPDTASPTAETKQAATGIAAAEPVAAEIVHSEAPAKDALSAVDTLGPKADLSLSANAPLALRPSAAPGLDMPVAVERELDLMRGGEWLDKLAREIVSVADRTDAMSFRLRPARLGEMDVSLTQSDEGVAVQLSTQNEEAGRIVAAAQPRLVESLQAQGVKVVEARVVDAPQRHEGQTGPQAQAGGGQPYGNQPHGSQQRAGAAQTIESAAALPETENREKVTRPAGRFA